MKKTIFLFVVLMQIAIITTVGTVWSKNADEKNDYVSQVCSMHQNVKNVILDTDLGSSTDDIFALQMLCRYAQNGQCTLLGVICNRKGEEKARFAKYLLSFYGMGNISVGLERSYPEYHKNFIDYCYESGDDSSTNIQSLGYKYPQRDSFPDGWILYRKLLANVPDNSVSIVSVGFLTTLSHLLNSGSDTISPLNGVELVKKKVKSIYIMGTKFEQKKHRARFGYNLVNPSPHYADTVFRKLPSSVKAYISPSSVGKYIGRYENDSVLNDIKDHSNPIYRVYENFDVDDGQYMWDVLPVLQLVEGNDNFFLSERGRVKTELADTTLVFIPDSRGNIQYQFIPSTWSKQDSLNFREFILSKIRNSFSSHYVALH